VISKLTEAP